MANKTVYVNPGDVLTIKFIHHPDLPKNEKEFRWQISSRRQQISLLCASGTQLYYWDGQVHVDHKQNWTDLIKN